MKIIGSILLLLVLAAFVLAFTGCAAVSSAITGQPIPTTPVQREGGKPFELATSDVLRAESSPQETAWGLYDAGNAAARAREVIDAGK